MDELLSELEWVHADCDHAAHDGGLTPQLQETVTQPSRPRKVLVLEDEPVQLYLLRQHLDSIGLQSVPAASIEEAWQRLQEVNVQLAILDVHLPDGSGLELCRKIDEDDRLSGLPVLVLSSSTESDVVRQTRAAGGCYFISKPYDPNVLLAIIERSLDSEL